MTRDPPEGSGFAIGNDEQYRPVQAAGPGARARGSAELTRLHTMRS
jgi:hypothetical protein